MGYSQLPNLKPLPLTSLSQYGNQLLAGCQQAEQALAHCQRVYRLVISPGCVKLFLLLSFGSLLLLPLLLQVLLCSLIQTAQYQAVHLTKWARLSSL